MKFLVMRLSSPPNTRGVNVLRVQIFYTKVLLNILEINKKTASKVVLNKPTRSFKF